jgi:asparagine synthase (glutamine-hydrolysing)
MTATMALRGPDAEGLWVDQHVAFGHRRLAVIDLEGGAQPMTAEHDQRTIAALNYTGEVYNYRELREELRSLGHTFRTNSDTEVVLHSFLEWGEASVERLNGMYAFALWDAPRQRLLLVRDRMGIKPLFYAPLKNGVLFGSEPKAIHAHPEVGPVVDLDGLRELMSFVKTPGHGVYRGVNEVRPGHIVVVDRSGISSRRYWSLGTTEHRDDLPTTVRTIRELLEDIVTRQLIADVPLCSLLSGGLDSSAITALAAVALRQAGAGSLHSFAVDFVGQTERFQPDALRDTPDAPYVHEVAKHTGADHSDIMLDNQALVDPIYRHAGVAACDSFFGSHDMFTSLYLLFRAVRQHSTVALSGESADEVFGGYRWFHDPLAVAANTFPWLGFARRTPSSGRSGDGDSADQREALFAPEILRALDLENYRRESYRDALATVEQLPSDDATERRMREICHLHLTRFVQILLDRKDRLSMANGLEVRVPFCDHRLVEYVYNTPWSMKTFDGREKSLLRAAVADLLPQSVVERRKSPYPSTQDPAYHGALRRMLIEVLSERTSPVLSLLRPERVDEILKATRRASSTSAPAFGGSRAGEELILGLNQWLLRYPVRLAL